MKEIQQKNNKEDVTIFIIFGFFIGIFIIIFSIMAWATLVLSEDLPLKTTYVSGPNAMSKIDVEATIEDIQNFWKLTFRYNIIPVAFNKVDDDYNYNPDLKMFWDALLYYHWKDNLKLTRKAINLVVLPPIIDNAVKYNAGMAEIGTYKRHKTFALVYCANLLGCTICSLHEILHTLGATHNRSRNQIMHPAAGQFGMDALAVTHRTKVQVRRYLNAVS